MQAKIKSNWHKVNYPGLGCSFHYMKHESWTMHIVYKLSAIPSVSFGKSTIYGPKRKRGGSKEKTLISILKA